MDTRRPLGILLLSLCLQPLARAQNHGSTAHAVPVGQPSARPSPHRRGFLLARRLGSGRSWALQPD